MNHKITETTSPLNSSAVRRAAFFDIDGTLWNFRNEIPESTIRALKLLQENNVLTFLNSGRTRAFITNENLLSIGFDGIVSGCGTMIEYHGETIFQRLLSKEQSSKTLEILRKYNFLPILEGPNYLYFEYEDFADDIYGKKLLRELGEKRRSIREYEDDLEIQKFSCIAVPENARACYEELDAALNKAYIYLEHNATIVEVIPRGFHKGTGIEQVCSLLGIDIENTYAFGDSVNDHDMLRTAGHSIAMGNGTEETKAIAEYVTTSLDEDGIWNACRHFGLI